MTAKLDGTRVLITGADGFIGSHVAERMVREGATVRALCHYNSFGSSGWLDSVPDAADAMEIRLGDIRDEGFTRDASLDIDIILHLAALIAIPYSYQAPSSFLETNMRGTLNVLEAARRGNVARVVQTSTSEVYGTPHTIPITENHPLQAQSPYAASKIAADKLCESFASSFELPVVILRPFNTYGPRQSARAVIPTILGQLLAGADTIELGSLHPRRDFTYVDDTVEGFVRIATADLQMGTVVQLGTGRAVSIGDLVELCFDVTGTRAEVVTQDERIRPVGSEVQVLLSDATRARDLLGWEPLVPLRSGLEATAAWLRGRVNAQTASRYLR